MNSTIRLVIRFVVLVLLQVLVLNHVRLGGYMNPYLYVLFVLLLPFSISGWALLMLSFFLGFTVDVFSNTGGIHAAATVLMALFRPNLVKLYYSKEDFEPNASPSLKYMGFQYFLGYSLVLVSIHHLALFSLEVFRFSEFGFTFLRALLSIALTLLIIIISQYLFYVKK
ncbi:MAG: rod shape-determining protein MreD [Bacteroidales bacterium]|nr:rod shape-determining protein MreD [Bacteroidales bacterium]MDZ4205197.1 rod shape-determining protein MreD [Bacteroidales bacterium]